MPEMHLRQAGLTYSVCGTFIKNKERIQKFKETGDSRYICQNELDKACLQHGVAYGILEKEQLLTKYCVINHLILLKIKNMMNIKGVLLQWFYDFFKKICFSCTARDLSYAR